jgi:hypothetical protein
MKIQVSTLLSFGLTASRVAAFPWMMDSSMDDFEKRAIKGLDVIKRDPELVSMIRDMYTEQLQEREVDTSHLRSTCRHLTKTSFSGLLCITQLVSDGCSLSGQAVDSIC